jgi:DNA-3-methyladenine glycosylase I
MSAAYSFRFTGGQIVGEFLTSVGYLPGAHEPDCPVYARVLELSPPWTRIGPTATAPVEDRV